VQKVTLPPNVPQLLSLQQPEGVYNPDMREVEYLTTDTRPTTRVTPSVC
jgi:hypothetical protein